MPSYQFYSFFMIACHNSNHVFSRPGNPLGPELQRPLYDRTPLCRQVTPWLVSWQLLMKCCRCSYQELRKAELGSCFGRAPLTRPYLGDNHLPNLGQELLFLAPRRQTIGPSGSLTPPKWCSGLAVMIPTANVSGKLAQNVPRTIKILLSTLA